jgi:hypothetical protein
MCRTNEIYFSLGERNDVLLIDSFLFLPEDVNETVSVIPFLLSLMNVDGQLLLLLTTKRSQRFVRSL